MALCAPSLLQDLREVRSGQAMSTLLFLPAAQQVPKFRSADSLGLDCRQTRCAVKLPRSGTACSLNIFNGDIDDSDGLGVPVVLFGF